MHCHLWIHFSWWDPYLYPIWRYSSWIKNDLISFYSTFIDTSGKKIVDATISIDHCYKFHNTVKLNDLVKTNSFYRITVPLAFSVGFVATIAPLVSSGPFYYSYIRDYTDGCRKNGWLNILYMNIYQDMFMDDRSAVSLLI